MAQPIVNEAKAAVLEDQIAEVCGLLNAATGRLVDLIAQVLESGAWQGWGIRTPEQWVAWKCGVGAGRARALVTMARRMRELPETRAAFVHGDLSEDQVAVVCRHAPAHVDAEVATLARSATVSQLKRTLSSYVFASEPTTDGDRPEDREHRRRRVGFGYTDEGDWRLSALLPADEGALWERALGEARDALFQERTHDRERGASPVDVGWADAFVAVADRSLTPGAAVRTHRDRHVVLLHVDATGDSPTEGHLHLGPGLAPGLRRYLTCDSRVRPVFERGGSAVSVGRAFRTVPERTRIVVEERDRSCKVPGCERTRWLQVHHIRHWEDGGGTDTANLVALCSHHHRLHHLGGLDISGDGNDPNGVVFTDRRGRRLTGSGRPAPPAEGLGSAAARLGVDPTTWSHPTGERLDYRWVHFNEA